MTPEPERIADYCWAVRQAGSTRIHQLVYAFVIRVVTDSLFRHTNEQTTAVFNAAIRNTLHVPIARTLRNINWDKLCDIKLKKRSSAAKGK